MPDDVRLVVDISSRHPRISIRPLDWFDVLDPGLELPITTFLSEANPELVLGADIVRTFIVIHIELRS